MRNRFAFSTEANVSAYPIKIFNPTGAMLSEANKHVLSRHFNEVLNTGALDVIDEIYSDNYVLDAPVQTSGSVQAHGETHGGDGLKRRVTLFRGGFPDIHFTVDNLVAEGDQVVVQYTFAGTHLGQFGELEPTGQHMAVKGILIAQVKAGKIESAVSVFDSGDMMHQLEPQHQPLFHHFVEWLRDTIT
jgi:predicted ester cyclase